MILAAMVAILPFLGLPQAVKNPLFVILGILIFLFSFAKSHYAAGYEADQVEQAEINFNPIKEESSVNDNDKIE